MASFGEFDTSICASKVSPGRTDVGGHGSLGTNSAESILAVGIHLIATSAPTGRSGGGS